MTEGLSALREGRAVVDLSGWRKVLVRGTDAAAWLNDILTAELSGLRTGEGRRSLLLSPTGRVRADLTVTPFSDGFLLLQDPIQAVSIRDALSPYVLSSDVELEERLSDLRLAALPEGASPEGVATFRPSPLGTGRGALGERGVALDVPGLVTATSEDVDAYRIELGVPRVGVDLGEDSLPHEAPLEEAIAQDKGCFLGQEAVAKVRNLGHPPFVVVALRGPGGLGRGDPVVAAGGEAGRITSATGLEGETAALARIRWAAREAALTTESGKGLRRVATRSGWSAS
jgi:tRNA-modifying protein YgfZ